MKPFIAGLCGAAVLASSAAHAQDAAQAFQCDQPYRETMIAMGSLEMLRLSEVKAFPGLHGDGEMIEFVSDNTLAYGLKPKALSVKLLPPHPVMNVTKQYTVAFISAFEPTVANDDAIMQAVPWHLDACHEWAERCYRDSKATPQGGGRLSYIRIGDDPELKCTFTFTPKEFESLGD